MKVIPFEVKKDLFELVEVEEFATSFSARGECNAYI